MIFKAHSRVSPQIIRANLVRLRASSNGNYAKYRASRPDKRTARRTFRVPLVREELKLSGRYLMVGRSADECIPFLRCRAENGMIGLRDIYEFAAHRREEAVDVIEEIQQLPAPRSFRRPRSSHNFANEIFLLVPFNFHNSFTSHSRRRGPEEVRGRFSS